MGNPMSETNYETETAETNVTQIREFEARVEKVSSIVWELIALWTKLTLSMEEKEDRDVIPWSEASHPKKQSTWDCIVALLATPNMTAETYHEMWRAKEIEKGWKYGPEFKPEAMENFNLVAWPELGEEVRKGYNLFFGFAKVVIQSL